MSTSFISDKTNIPAGMNARWAWRPLINNRRLPMAQIKPLVSKAPLPFIIEQIVAISGTWAQVRITALIHFC
jgi:hypothetical protein